MITFFLSIILIIAHITYLFERLTFASDRWERNNRVPQVWSTLLGKMRLEILIATSNWWFQPKNLEFTFVEELIIKVG